MTIEPIKKFKDEQQAYECLKEWQSRLFLNDWIIKMQIIPISEMSVKNHVGENSYQTTNKCSFISIGNLDNDTETAMCKMHHEVTLVHELLHLKFIFADNVKNTTEGNFLGMHEHILIEQMAKSLIMAKYNLTFEWFKNF